LNALAEDDPGRNIFVEKVNKRSGFFTVILAVNGLGERFWPWIIFNGENQFEPSMRYLDPWGWCFVAFNNTHYNNQVLHYEYLRTTVIPNLGLNPHTGVKDPDQWSMVIHDSSSTHPHAYTADLLKQAHCCEVVIPGKLSKFSVLDDTYNRMFKTRLDKVRERFMVRWRGLSDEDPRKKLTAAQWREVVCFWVTEAVFDETPSKRGARPPASACYWAFQKFGVTVPLNSLAHTIVRLKIGDVRVVPDLVQKLKESRPAGTSHMQVNDHWEHHHPDPYLLHEQAKIKDQDQAERKTFRNKVLSRALSAPCRSWSIATHPELVPKKSKQEKKTDKSIIALGAQRPPKPLPGSQVVEEDELELVSAPSSETDRLRVQVADLTRKVTQFQTAAQHNKTYRQEATSEKNATATRERAKQKHLRDQLKSEREQHQRELAFRDHQELQRAGRHSPTHAASGSADAITKRLLQARRLPRHTRTDLGASSSRFSGSKRKSRT
jgi:hypothetical protein